MLLYGSPSSPFSRKVMTVVHELGLAGRVSFEATDPATLRGDPAGPGSNPLAQLPTLLDAGEAIYDSTVICGWLEARAGRRLSSETGFDTLRMQRDQALGDGMMDAAVLLRLEETLRPPEARSPRWIASQSARIEAGLAAMAARLPAQTGRVDLAAVTFACALDYLAFRHPQLDWQGRFPALVPWFGFWAARPSFQATAYSPNPSLAGASLAEGGR